MKDLLNLVAEQGGAELRLETERHPMMLLHGKVRVLDGVRRPANGFYRPCDGPAGD